LYNLTAIPTYKSKLELMVYNQSSMYSICTQYINIAYNWPFTSTGRYGTS